MAQSENKYFFPISHVYAKGKFTFISIRLPNHADTKTMHVQEI